MRMRDWWMLWRVPTLALVVMLAWWFVFRPIAQEQGWVRVEERFTLCGAPRTADEPRAAGCVIDGDTLALWSGSEQRRIRLIGFDAPELDGTCEAERELAEAARLRLHCWLSQDAFEWNGAEDPPRDGYGRELRSARRSDGGGGQDYLAETMTSSGLAAPRAWGERPRNWCE
jgi:endonuclease YncB( thermonuclease family)